MFILPNGLLSLHDRTVGDLCAGQGLTGRSLESSNLRPHLGYNIIWGYIGIMEKKMETTVVHWGEIGFRENRGFYRGVL